MSRIPTKRAGPGTTKRYLTQRHRSLSTGTDHPTSSMLGSVWSHRQGLILHLFDSSFSGHESHPEHLLRLFNTQAAVLRSFRDLFEFAGKDRFDQATGIAKALSQLHCEFVSAET